MLHYKANPFVTSQVEKDEEETILEAAVRWNQRKVISFLLLNVKWSLELLEKVLKQTRSEEVKLELLNKIQILRKQCVCPCSIFSWITRKTKVANAP